MHIDRIPVYRVYQRAIDLELYHSFAELVGGNGCVRLF